MVIFGNEPVKEEEMDEKTHGQDDIVFATIAWLEQSKDKEACAGQLGKVKSPAKGDIFPPLLFHE